MNNFAVAGIDGYGGLVLDKNDNETIIHKSFHVNLYDGEDNRTEHRNLAAIATTHRLVLANEDPGKVVYYEVPLSIVTSVTSKGRALFRKHGRVNLTMKGRTGHQPAFPDTRKDQMMITFHDQDEAKLADKISKALEEKAWTLAERTRKEQRAAYDRVYGIGGIKNRQQQQAKSGDALLGAFDDLTTLMKEAQRLADMAKTLQTQQAAAQQSDGNDRDKEELASMMATAGLVSPVTKDVSRDSYYTDLARQLAGFLAGPLKEAKGMLQVVDAYAMYNRARGTALVSSDDFMAVLRLFPELGIPIETVRLSSGVSVVQDSAVGTTALLEAVEGYLARFAGSMEDLSTLTPVTAAALAEEAGVTPILAKEALLLAEKKGLVCRDDHVGVAFYSNFMRVV
ncbi:hypothetical protein J8273_4741 [Carpediemonas membranifera]|uniref:Vacuolar protein-sorting-associated protein 36 n=1 Tax=Carpediemonas membranifera TaxID=201153 RepID=A0A8J6E410_9EUKA|nr:hypothetical protein J8273_4741 [Carpediemonas membranifera]QNO39398.1 vacuolar protein sorting 36A [Carpediemonas membranifera]|eukprot:KAG9393877.1 hypothetical protein J8273_4741 [Carpediemonas membranifera]